MTLKKMRFEMKKVLAETPTRFGLRQPELRGRMPLRFATNLQLNGCSDCPQ